MSSIDHQAATRLAYRLSLAANADRAEILIVLLSGDLSVTDLTAEIGRTSRHVVSNHLALLSVTGLVESRHEGPFVVYSLTESGRILAGLVASLEQHAEPAHRLESVA